MHAPSLPFLLVSPVPVLFAAIATSAWGNDRIFVVAIIVVFHGPCSTEDPFNLNSHFKGSFKSISDHRESFQSVGPVEAADACKEAPRDVSINVGAAVWPQKLPLG